MRRIKLALVLALPALLALLALTSTGGDPARAALSASADALAGSEERAPREGFGLEGHKSLADFSESDGAPSVRVRSFGGERYDWRPARGETRSRREIADRPWAGTLTAKEWCDAESFGQWLDLVGEAQGSAGPFARVARAWQLSTQERIALTLEDAGGRPVADVPVVLEREGEVLFRARTDNRGRAFLYPDLERRRSAGRALEGLRVIARGGGRAVSRAVRAGDALRLVLPLEDQAPAAVGDVMLVMDTTGSMSDELSYLQSELENVIARADHQLMQQVDMRLSVNFYRDRGDAYVLRSFPFTRSLAQATASLLEQRAEGGGDYPEAVELALADALEEHRWSASARGRLLFLVLDAPPRGGAAEVRSLQRSLADAAAKGIRIFPVAGSGVDKDTEFLLRHFAVITGGSYVYLTDDSGVGERHLEATGGRAQTERLNDLMTRLIVESLRDADQVAPVYQARR
ncbi:MAG: VWA domain-containing protein [Deltaproteobacteria bacterium]|nr:VWA domain-containing protein [Deltaproteobacteria bacterium]